jgi:ElaB/YqjD/DUF883 family membrane-anchored ribosome-binding protein
MFGNSKTSSSSTSVLADAGHSAEQALQAARDLALDAQDALDGLVDGVQQLSEQAAPMLNKAADRASGLARSSVDAVRDQAQRLREQAARGAANTTHYIRDEPVKSVLMAAAAGAALMAVFSLLSRPRA